jgi:hypothetical protein
LVGGCCRTARCNNLPQHSRRWIKMQVLMVVACQAQASRRKPLKKATSSWCKRSIKTPLVRARQILLASRSHYSNNRSPQGLAAKFTACTTGLAVARLQRTGLQRSCTKTRRRILSAFAIAINRQPIQRLITYYREFRFWCDLTVFFNTSMMALYVAAVHSGYSKLCRSKNIFGLGSYSVLQQLL